MMDAVKTYEYLVRARGRVFAWVGGLTDEQYRQVFPTGPGSIAKTLTHTEIGEWYYVQRMIGAEVAPHEEWGVRESDPPAFGVLKGLWEGQAALTTKVLAETRDWGEEVRYEVTDDDEGSGG